MIDLSVYRSRGRNCRGTRACRSTGTCCCQRQTRNTCYEFHRTPIYQIRSPLLSPAWTNIAASWV